MSAKKGSYCLLLVHAVFKCESNYFGKPAE